MKRKRARRGQRWSYTGPEWRGINCPRRRLEKQGTLRGRDRDVFVRRMARLGGREHWRDVFCVTRRGLGKLTPRDLVIVADAIQR